MATARARMLRRRLAVIVAIVAAITPVFNVLTDRATIDEAVQGVIDAVLVCLLVGGYLMFVRDGRARRWFRRLGFWTDLKKTGFDLVASGTILDRLVLPPGIAATPCGELALRGKEASVAAYGLTAG